MPLDLRVVEHERIGVRAEARHHPGVGPAPGEQQHGAWSSRWPWPRRAARPPRVVRADLVARTPYASSAATIADGPQPPLRLSRRLSHSPIRDASCFWNASVSGALPCIVEDHLRAGDGTPLVVELLVMKWFSGCLNRLTSTLTRFGGGLGCRRRRRAGLEGRRRRTARLGRGADGSSAVTGRGVTSTVVSDRPIRRRVDDQSSTLDALTMSWNRVADTEHVRPDGAGREQHDRRGRWRRRGGGAGVGDGSCGTLRAARPPERRVARRRCDARARAPSAPFGVGRRGRRGGLPVDR